MSTEDPDVALEVKKKLEDLNFQEYDVRADGIYVPAAARDKLILESSEVFGDKLIYQFLEEASITVSSWQLQQRLQVATQRKLERMISKIEAIKQVSLKITPLSKLRKKGFKAGAPATAAVQIVVRPGREFTLANTVAVANLIAAAVEGLKPEDVKIMDDKGRLYQVPPEGSTWAVVNTRTQAEVEVQEMIEENVLKILGGNAKV
ncbi:MAG: hypothetical protein ACYTAF_15350, partial [Planctomycetota bacterium]